MNALPPDEPASPAPETPSGPPPLQFVPPPPAKRKWGCLQWFLIAAAIGFLLFGLCTVLVFSNLDFR
jgi:hypothetical protein